MSEEFKQCGQNDKSLFNDLQIGLQEAIDYEMGKGNAKVSNIMLDKRCCDIYDNCSNTQTIREWIHNTYKALYAEDIIDDALDKMSESELKDFIEELDWLADK